MELKKKLVTSLLYLEFSTVKTNAVVGTRNRNDCDCTVPNNRIKRKN